VENWGQIPISPGPLPNPPKAIDILKSAMSEAFNLYSPSRLIDSGVPWSME
jgi:hypothetical protein